MKTEIPPGATPAARTLPWDPTPVGGVWVSFALGLLTLTAAFHLGTLAGRLLARSLDLAVMAHA